MARDVEPTRQPPSMAAERLRADTDAGLTGDKVPFPDPAAAPLGTDDEAAGTPPPPAVARDRIAPKDARTPPQQKKGTEHDHPFDR